MAREFSITGAALTVAGTPTLVGFLPPTTAGGPDFQILRMWAGQITTAAVSQRIESYTQVSAYPTVVTATPKPLKLGDPTVSLLSGVAGILTAGKCGINASGEGAGAKTLVFPDVFNTNNGYLWVPTPREIVSVPASYASSFGLWFPVAPVPLTNWSFGLNYGEGI